MKHISLFAATIGVGLLLLSLPATGPTGAHPASTSTMTPVAARYPLSSEGHGSPLDDWFRRSVGATSKHGGVSTENTSQIGDLLYEDDFSDPTSGWPTGNDEERTLEYLRGEYRIRIKKVNWSIGTTPGQRFTDMALEVDARFASTVSGAYGLLFGINDDWDWYGFWVSNDGYYAIYKHIDATSDWQALQAWTFSSLISQGQASNHLRAIRDGAQIAVYINDEYLNTVTDGSFMGSLRVGLAAETFDRAGVDARFDNFRVYALETSQEASPTPTNTSTLSGTPTQTSTATTTATPTATETAAQANSVYQPLVLRNWPPTPTPTPTPTATPIPGLARLYLCCWATIDEDCYIGGRGCTQSSWLRPDGRLTWRSGTLLVDIVGTTYGFGIAASSEGSTTFEVQLFLVQEGGELLLASTSFTASSSQSTRYERVVQGIDPVVSIDQDRLRVTISHVSGDAGQIYSGVPGFARAGGSYIDFVVSQAANRVSIISTGECPLPIETAFASPAGIWRRE